MSHIRKTTKTIYRKGDRRIKKQGDVKHTKYPYNGR